MSINKKIIIALAIGTAFGVSSCKKYLDVNKNPNVVQTATVQTLLPAAQLMTSSSLGVDLEINGSFWAQYWTQNPGASQYHVLDEYAPGQDQFSNPWLNLYAANENFRQLYILADSQKKKQYMAVALLMEAYTYQLITDGWGDVPFTQALLGQYSDGHIVNPKYDAQMAVYKGIIAYIDSANVLINPNDPAPPGADDLIYGGNMLEWQKFSNTLMLRVLMRMSLVDPTDAQAGITALYATAGGNFIGEGDDAVINYGYSSANKNPLNAEMTSATLASAQNLVGSNTCIDSMNGNGDYRAYIFYEATAATGNVAGVPQGYYPATAPAAGTFSIPSPYVGGDAQNSASASAPVKFITSYESLFLQAEAVVRFGAPGDDAALFAAGIHASFFAYSNAYTNMNLEWADTAGLAEGDGFVLPSGDTLLQPVYLTADFAYYSYLHGDTVYENPPSAPEPAYWSQYPVTGSSAQKIMFIITQKWFSMCGNQGFEAWSEWRRTGFPNFFIISQSSIIGNQFPKRFLYPTSESTVNSSYPGLAPLTSKVWWDIL